MATSRICSIPGCGKPHKARGWCINHYVSWRKTRDPLGTPSREYGKTRRFLFDVAIGYDRDDCLVWPYARNPQGYAKMSFEGRTTRVHQIVCEIVHGQRPASKRDVAHSCGNGHLGCVNPRHLRWATRRENVMDRVLHHTDNRGEKHPFSKLTASDVITIRSGELRAKDAAAKFGISRRYVHRIRAGDYWGWLE